MSNKKPWGYIWTIQDMCIWKGALEVLSITIPSTQATAQEVKIRDGRDVSSNIVARLFGTKYHTGHYCFPEPLHLENGLFVEFVGGPTGVLVIWRPL